jgi:hypothetical protein
MDPCLIHFFCRFRLSRSRMFPIGTRAGSRIFFHVTNAVEAIVNSVDGHGFLPMLAGTVDCPQGGLTKHCHPTPQPQYTGYLVLSTTPPLLYIGVARATSAKLRGAFRVQRC